jgi:hypothetical protein
MASLPLQLFVVYYTMVNSAGHGAVEISPNDPVERLTYFGSVLVESASLRDKLSMDIA